MAVIDWTARACILSESMLRAKNNGYLKNKGKLCLFRVQAIDKNAPGVTCSSSNTLGRILFLFCFATVASM